MKKLDFKTEKVQQLDYETLLNTIPENDYEGKPIGGFYHYQVIESIVDSINKYGLKARIEDMFAAKNHDSKRPGVSILPEKVAMYGDGAPETFILRRIYTTIVIGDEYDGMRNALAISYNQNGIQVAFGPNVKICHNQTILGSQYLVSNYGYGNVSKIIKSGVPFWQPFVDAWLGNIAEHQEKWIEEIGNLRNRYLSMSKIKEFFGSLLYNRIGVDCGAISRKDDNAPLSCTQINTIIRDYLVNSEDDFSAWDLVNLLTNVLKPKTADMATLLPSSVKALEYVKKFNDLY